jgi:hypothetical protein
MKPTQDETGEWHCEHGTALDVHCCNCHSGFLFDIDWCVCLLDQSPAAREATTDASVSVQPEGKPKNSTSVDDTR